MNKTCDVCGSTHMPVTTYKCTGSDFGRPIEDVISLCICCDANTDNEWLENYFGWDHVTNIEAMKR